MPLCADLLGFIFLNYDRVLICGDFNIHICCEADLLAKDFLALIDSFNLTLWVRKSTHTKGHMLDLVLSYRLDICITDINDAGISDHFPVMFDVQLCNMELNSEGPLCLSRLINSEAVALFSAAFANSVCYDDISNAPLSVDGAVNSFISTCSSILDTVAPVKTKRRKTSRQPWLNEYTLALRHECRRAERRWKKDQLQVSLDILHMSQSKFQKAAKMTKTSFLSNIIATNSHNPRVLFKIFNSVVNPCSDVSMGASPAICEKFLNHFIDKISVLRAPHSPVVNQAPVSKCSTVFQQFEPVSFSTLKEIINNLRSSNSLHDIIPSRIIKDALKTIGSCILFLMNSSLLSGCVPTVFKHAVVQPVIKKSSLDHNTLANYRPISKLPFMSKS